ncbi:MAG: hypothetical protein AB7T49_10045 [Oligoflexales bacterium]
MKLKAFALIAAVVVPCAQAETLKLAVVKIDGERFEKYMGDQGSSVYLPSRVFTPEEKAASALCEPDLAGREVLVLRESVPLAEASVKEETKLVEMLKICGKSREAIAPKTKAAESKIQYKVEQTTDPDKKSGVKAILPNGGGSFHIEHKPDAKKDPE